jgi:serine/threonine protein kinase/lipoprotein NlpI
MLGLRFVTIVASLIPFTPEAIVSAHLDAGLAPNPVEESQQYNSQRTGNNNDPGSKCTDVVRCSPPVPKPLFPAVGDSLLHFELLGELGSGAFSRVYLASQHDLAGRPVALKVSECEDGEPQRLARLQHANIVPIYSVHNVFQFQIVCMPFVGSHTLATVLKLQSGQPQGTGRDLVNTLRNRSTSLETARSPSVHGEARAAKTEVVPLSPNLELLNRLSHVDAVLWIAARLADGLSHAHDRGILHCDLKPQNVLISDDGQPMLLDFNVSIDARHTGARPAYIGGTIPFMAPEHLEAVVSGRLAIDVRADLYSLGVILFHMLTGHDPHDLSPSRPPDTPGYLLEVRRRPPSPPSGWNPDITPAVDSILLKLLAPNAANRYASAANLREDLERHLAHRPLLHAPNTSIIERVRKWRRRHPRSAAVVATAAVAAVFLLLPATIITVRRHEIQKAEASLKQSAALDDLRKAQILLSTQTADRSLLDEGFALGRKVLDEYQVAPDGRWKNGPLVRKLTEAQQSELRRELGELLLLLARGERLRASPGDTASFQAALQWNRMAETCFPADARPRWLSRQRAELLALSPGNAEPIPEGSGSELDAYHEGLEHASHNRYSEALTALVPFSERHHDHFMGWFVRGICHEGLGQMNEAAAAFTVCIALRPEMPWSYFNRGLVRLRQRSYEAAERDFTSALRLKPDLTWALIDRAIARDARRNWVGAEQDLTSALQQSGAPTRVYFIRSKVRRDAGDIEGADRDAAEGLKNTPADSLSWVTRGVWRQEENPKEALADFDEALKLNPRCREALQDKAVVLADLLGKPVEAARVMTQLLEIYPTYVEARAGRGVYRARAGEAQGARADADEVLRDEPSAYRSYQMAGLFAQLSRFEADTKARHEALRQLAQAFRSGFSDFALLKKDSDLDPIRDSEEFRSLVAHAEALQLR